MYAKREPDPLNVYHNMRGHGAVPPLGSMGALLRTLTSEERARLYRRIKREDRVLSDTVVRILREALT
jgi:hypothetical protein